MSTYPTLAAYTADVEKARAAYNADQAVAAGFCAVCKTRKRDRRDSTSLYRRCFSCRHSNRREGAV